MGHIEELAENCNPGDEVEFTLKSQGWKRYRRGIVIDPRFNKKGWVDTHHPYRSGSIGGLAMKIEVTIIGYGESGTSSVKPFVTTYLYYNILSWNILKKSQS